MSGDTRLIRVAHSPDSDDAFMFWALAEDKIPTGRWRFEHVLSDIETLNRKAEEGEYEVTAVSIHAYAYLHARYALLDSGASMGDNYGPMLVTSRPIPLNEIKSLRIAIPGKRTSAALALQLCLGRNLNLVVFPFDAITDAVKQGKVEAGLLIHEGQLTYQRDGLYSAVNLGQWWHSRTDGLPLPLGGNTIRRDLGPSAMREIAGILKASIRYGLDHRETALSHAMKYARNLARPDADKFVGMYVNDLTIDYGDRGRAAVHLFLDQAFQEGLIPHKVPIEFISDN